MHHPPSRPHRASRRLPPQPLLAFAPPPPTPSVRAVEESLVEASPRLRQWLKARRASLAVSTGGSDRIITLGAGDSGLAEFAVGCDRPGAMLHTEKGLHVAAQSRLWRLDDALSDGENFQGTDRLCLPSQCRPTGPIGIEDLAVEASGKLLAAASAFNCVARINSRGDLKPVWRPAFIDKIVREDRCHLTGFCLRDGVLAYATVTAACNDKDGWRQSHNGGQVIETATHRVLAEGLDQPRAPRLYRNRLWILESGSGALGWVDLERRRFECFAQLPGVAHGLRFVGDHALVTTSGAAGIHWVNLKSGKVDHRVTFKGSIATAIDVALIPGETAPRLAGLSLADTGLEETQQIAG